MSIYNNLLSQYVYIKHATESLDTADSTELYLPAGMTGILSQIEDKAVKWVISVTHLCVIYSTTITVRGHKEESCGFCFCFYVHMPVILSGNFLIKTTTVAFFE